mmetsp:Transcript_32402/g.74873  ORF Transcript_32402/g.74873 Transcript_32402/m.74873 type:complete len:273 (-) Transcript_32402:1832-2650(-)
MTGFKKLDIVHQLLHGRRDSHVLGHEQDLCQDRLDDRPLASSHTCQQGVSHRASSLRCIHKHAQHLIGNIEEELVFLIEIVEHPLRSLGGVVGVVLEELDQNCRPRHGVLLDGLLQLLCWCGNHLHGSIADKHVVKGLLEQPHGRSHLLLVDLRFNAQRHEEEAVGHDLGECSLPSSYVYRLAPLRICRGVANNFATFANYLPRASHALPVLKSSTRSARDALTLPGDTRTADAHHRIHSRLKECRELGWAVCASPLPLSVCVCPHRTVCAL